MSVAYWLYDALVSINVPNEKAKAVLEAMERDMLSQLVTRTEFTGEMKLVRQEFGAKFDLLSRDIQATNARIDNVISQLTLRFVGIAAALASIVAFAARLF